MHHGRNATCSTTLRQPPPLQDVLESQRKTSVASHLVPPQSNQWPTVVSMATCHPPLLRVQLPFPALQSLRPNAALPWSVPPQSCPCQACAICPMQSSASAPSLPASSAAAVPPQRFPQPLALLHIARPRTVQPPCREQGADGHVICLPLMQHACHVTEAKHDRKGGGSCTSLCQQSEQPCPT